MKEDTRSNSRPESVYFEMHRLTWGEGDERVALFIAGTEAHLVRRAAGRLAATIAFENGQPVSDDIIMSSNIDLDELPF